MGRPAPGARGALLRVPDPGPTVPEPSALERPRQKELPPGHPAMKLLGDNDRANVAEQTAAGPPLAPIQARPEGWSRGLAAAEEPATARD
eukprot:6847731-Lingulodinium_polyedra.AAC.1